MTTGYTLVLTMGGARVDTLAITQAYPTITSITFLIPAIPPGTYDVTATTEFDSLIVPGITVNPSLTISSVTPNTGSLNQVVQVLGTSFGGSIAVSVGGVAAAVIGVTPTAIAIYVPNAGAVGAKNVVVTSTTNGSATLFAGFYYTGTASISSLTPNRGRESSTHAVTIAGTNFSDPTIVTVGGTLATDVVVVSPTQVTCTFPALAAGVKTVTVATGANGSPTSSFTYFYECSLYGSTVVVESPDVFQPALDAESDVACTGVAVNITPEANYADPPGRAIDLYDASGVGEGLTKNHYLQIFLSGDQLRQSLETQHDPADLSSQFSVLGLRGLKKVQKTVSVSTPVGTAALVEIADHAGAHYSGVHVLSSPADLLGEALSGDTAWCSLRFAFDDTKVYGVVTLEQQLTGFTNAFTAIYTAYLFDPAAPSLPAVDAPNFTNPAALSKSTGNDVYTRLRSNAALQRAVYEAEHDLRTGEHKISPARLKGYAVVLDADVSAPTGIGGVQYLKIEDRTGRRYRYLQPSVVGNAGCGIIAASIGMSATAVYLILRRITTGSTNVVRARCYRVDDE